MVIIKPEAPDGTVEPKPIEVQLNKWQKVDGTLTIKGKTFEGRIEQVLRDEARNLTYDEILLLVAKKYPTDYSIDIKDLGTAKHIQTTDIQFMVRTLVQEDKVIDR